MKPASLDDPIASFISPAEIALRLESLHTLRYNELAQVYYCELLNKPEYL